MVTPPVLVTVATHYGTLEHTAYAGDRRALCGAKIARHAATAQNATACRKCGASAPTIPTTI